MKNLLSALFAFIFFGSFMLMAQTTVIDNFESSAASNTYNTPNEGPPTIIELSDNTADFQEGSASLKVKTVLGAFHDYGTYSEIQNAAPDGEYFDWSISDSISLWIRVYQAAANPETMVFRIQLRDKPAPGDDPEQYVYENSATLDQTSGWFNLRVPLYQVESDGTVNPNDQGFVITPTNWGLTSNNKKLDFDKIISYGFVAVTTANVVDSVEVGYDNFTRFGYKSIPTIIFNGIAIPSNLASWSWGQSNISVETGAGPVPNTNALKWVQGNEWGNGWTGIGFTSTPPLNLAGAWQKDSVKLKLKCDPGVDTLRIQYEGGPGKVGTIFKPIADGQWHEYAFPLREMVYQDNTSGFDSSSVQVVGLMAEATGIAGKVVYITDWWTGNPDFDVIPPDPPQNITVISGTFLNIVMWEDVQGEAGEKYSVYYSINPISDLKADGVEVAKIGIAENEQLYEHLIFAPGTDQNLTLYYVVTCKDAAGNESIISANSNAVTNTAKGVTTISLSPPTNFVADGDLAEWQSIAPFRMFPSDGTGHIVTNTAIDGDADLSVLSYVAADATYLYIAFDVEDDIVSFDPAKSTYHNDSPDIFLGLYNWHGVPHTAYQGGLQPDYHLRFAKDRIIEDHLGSAADSVVLPGADYYWGETFPTGYSVEARISWEMLAGLAGDNVFVPVEGYRIPIDFTINDRDATGEREGMLTYSPVNEDQSWNDVSRWLYTWIGNLMYPVGLEDEGLTVNEYSLSQNYPNPFNPSTVINYSLKNDGRITLKIFDVLGREVATLVNEEQNAGKHFVQFDGKNLSSGIYFYKLESGSFSQTNKMMLLK